MESRIAVRLIFSTAKIGPFALHMKIWHCLWASAVFG